MKDLTGIKGLIRLYRKNSILQFLISYILILICPLLIISSGFQDAFRIVENDLKSSHVSMLRHSSDVIGNQLKTMENMALQTSQDAEILEFAEVEQGDKGYIMTAMNALNNFSMYLNYQNIEFLGDAYIYFRGMNLVLYEGTYYQPEIFRKYLTEWGVTEEEWLEDTVSTNRWYPGYHRSGDSFEYVFPFFSGLERPDGNQGVIVYRVNKSALEPLLDFQDSYGNSVGMVQILDKNGELLWTLGDGADMPSDIRPDMLKENEFQVRKGVGIVSVRDVRLNWTYMLAVPEKQAMYQLELLKNLVMVLAAVAVFGGLVYAIIMAFRRGRPINEVFRVLSDNEADTYTYKNLGSAVTRLVTNHQEVLKELEREKPFKKAAFFQELLQAEYSSEDQIRLSARKAGVAIEGNVYQVALFQVFGGNDIYTVDEQTLNEVHVISKLMENYLEEHWKGTVWFCKQDYKTMVVIFSLNDMGEDCRLMVEETREWLLQECQLKISWGIGDAGQDLTLIWRSMEEARIALDHTSSDHPVVRYRSDLVNTGEYYLPYVAREKLKEFISSGQKKELEEILTILEWENCTNRKLNRTQFLKLSRSLMDILAGVPRLEDFAADETLSLNEVLVAPEISQKEYFRRYRQLCRTACSESGEKKQIQKGKMIEEIMNYIQAHFSEADMGLAKVGMAYQLSEGYLSVLFKEQAGVNFADFLEQTRIQKACELLKDRSLTVNQVAQQVGYNSVQSFRRAFKRVRGISPKEVRKPQE